MRKRVLFVTLFCCGHAVAGIHKFEAPGRHLGVWRLTDDPAIRDEGNYHNVQCWSANGRYTCYTHWGGTKGPGGKGDAEVHVVDLMSGEDRLVGKGFNPRWGNTANHLFYCHYIDDGTPRYETGSQIIRYDADTGEKVVITHGMEVPSGTDADDKWVFGMQRFRKQRPQYRTVRALNRPNSKLEVLKDAPNRHHRLVINPRYPVIMVRTFPRGGTAQPHDVQRALMDLDGSNHRAGFIQAEKGHSCWGGDGEYLLTGDGTLRGRKWNQPYPSDLEVFTFGKTGNDVSPCGKSGRYTCSGWGQIVDMRSGDQWFTVHFGSKIIWPIKGDNSHIVDSDSKGSPDGTKMHFHSTCDIENLVQTRVTRYDNERPDVIEVGSTEGFPPSGDLVASSEVIGYRRKTATTFEGLTRQKYDSFRAGRLGVGRVYVSPLSRFVLSGKDKARAKPLKSLLKHGFASDHPLMYQRQTDCYVVVVRLPFRPHLRLHGGLVQLIPGEAHWETRGYRLLRDGKPLSGRLVPPGGAFELPGAGLYTAVAVEWSGLESPPSLTLSVERPVKGRILQSVPSDFSWTRKTWKIGERSVSAAEAMRAPEAVMELVHLHDGVIAREQWRNGVKRTRVDLNADGKPTRLLEFENGRLRKRTHQTPDGVVGSVELYGPDGWKTDWIEYEVYRPGDRRGREKEHVWYDHGRPVKRRSWRGNFDFTKKQGSDL